jgi:hypothetical protein
MQRVEQRPPARIISPVVAAGPSPANKAGLEFDIGEPRVHATMPPGLSRSEMVEWLTKHCRNTSDPISLDEYADMELKDLRSLVRLGSGFCYTADGLTSHIKSAVERDLPVKNILNPGYRLDARDFGAIEKQGRLLRKTYKLPTREAEIPAAHYKLFIDVVAEPNYKYVFLYDNRKLKKVAGGKVDYTPAIPDGGWLGYIPAAGTDELEKLIKKAHKVGRLFTKAERPFKCCRVHVKKSKEYWTGDVATKISAMEEEIRGIL